MMGCAGYVGWMWIWPTLVLIGLAALTVLAVLVARGGLGTHKATERPDTDSTAGARRILDERYARGDIDEEDYRQRRDMLR
jgi:putative membrane protein